MATLVISRTVSLSNCSRLLLGCRYKELTPVMLLPGRASVETNPDVRVLQARLGLGGCAVVDYRYGFAAATRSSRPTSKPVGCMNLFPVGEPGKFVGEAEFAHPQVLAVARVRRHSLQAI